MLVVVSRKVSQQQPSYNLELELHDIGPLKSLGIKSQTGIVKLIPTGIPRLSPSSNDSGWRLQAQINVCHGNPGYFGRSPSSLCKVLFLLVSKSISCFIEPSSCLGWVHMHALWPDFGQRLEQ